MGFLKKFFSKFLNKTKIKPITSKNAMYLEFDSEYNNEENDKDINNDEKTLSDDYINFLKLIKDLKNKDNSVTDKNLELEEFNNELTESEQFYNLLCEDLSLKEDFQRFLNDNRDSNFIEYYPFMLLLLFKTHIYSDAYVTLYNIENIREKEKIIYNKINNNDFRGYYSKAYYQQLQMGIDWFKRMPYNLTALQLLINDKCDIIKKNYDFIEEMEEKYPNIDLDKKRTI